MAKAKGSTKDKLRPTISDEAREARMVSMAMDLAEQRLMDGTASSQLIVELLKRNSPKYKLENEKLREENKLLRARTEAIESAKEVEKLYKEALDAMRRYGGHGDADEY